AVILAFDFLLVRLARGAWFAVRGLACAWSRWAEARAARIEAARLTAESAPVRNGTARRAAAAEAAAIPIHRPEPAPAAEPRAAARPRHGADPPAGRRGARRRPLRRLRAAARHAPRRPGAVPLRRARPAAARAGRPPGKDVHRLRPQRPRRRHQHRPGHHAV